VIEVLFKYLTMVHLIRPPHQREGVNLGQRPDSIGGPDMTAEIT